MIRRLLLSTFMVLILAGLPVNATQGQTIARFLADNGGAFDENGFDFDILRRAVATASLVSALQDREVELTLFAPNDRAFLRLARDLGYVGNSEAEVWGFLVEQLTIIGEGDPIGPLTNILLYHVAPEDIGIVQFILSSEIGTLLPDASFQVRGFIRMVDNDPDINNPRLLFPLNVQYSNGTVHGISRVLLPLDL